MARQTICWRSTRFRRGFRRWGGGAGAVAPQASPLSISTPCSAFMRPRFPKKPGPAPNHQGVLVLHHPFDLLALLHLQGLGELGRTHQVKLAAAPRPLDHLYFGKVSHGGSIQLVKMLVK